MKSFKEIFCDFIKQPDILFFYGFLLTFTLSIRKVLFFYPIGRQFNEYTGIYLYLSDIFIILMLASAGISILYNKILNKSIYIVDIVPYLKQKIIIIPLILVFSSFISTFWSSNWQIAIFRSIKLVEFYLLYLWAIFRVFHPHNVPRLPCSDKLFHVEQFNCYQGGTFLNNVFLIMIGTGIIQSAIGIWQFIIQKSIGTLWLKESLISPEIVGVAKIVFNGEKYIRAYGLFPHPNILGGFLILSIILTILYFKLSHLNKNDLLHQKCSTPALQRQIVPRGT
ncbi:MAG: hypothetical protein Q7R95_10740, partial [bacterium]|nr:hypothetical protein [bacterium]